MSEFTPGAEAESEALETQMQEVRREIETVKTGPEGAGRTLLSGEIRSEGGPKEAVFRVLEKDFGINFQQIQEESAEPARHYPDGKISRNIAAGDDLTVGVLFNSSRYNTDRQNPELSDPGRTRTGFEWIMIGRNPARK